VHIDVREDARAIIAAHAAATGRELNEARLRMARIPDRATLIDNPVSHAPGFSLGNVHVMAGVPSIFRAMLEGLASRLQGGPPLLSHSFRAHLAEGDLASPLAAVAAAHPGVSMGSYPFYVAGADGGPGAALILRCADPAELACAADTLRAALAQMGAPVEELPPS